VKKLISGIVIIAVGLFLLEHVLGQESDKRNYQYFDDMTQTFAYKTQSTNPHLKSGQTQQASIPGTIPRGYMPLHYGNSEAELVRAGEELVNPFSADTHVARGEVVYQNQCMICHGAGGEGDGPVTKRGFPPPTSLFSEQAVGRTDGQMFHIITYGFKNMPLYASSVDIDDRWFAINYIRQLQVNNLNEPQATSQAPAEGGKE
jgi:mono/diheme cytochrome c family protein